MRTNSSASNSSALEAPGTGPSPIRRTPSTPSGARPSWSKRAPVRSVITSDTADASAPQSDGSIDVDVVNTQDDTAAGAAVDDGDRQEGLLEERRVQQLAEETAEAGAAALPPDDSP